MTGARGPVPKRTDQRRRRNTDAGTKPASKPASKSTGRLATLNYPDPDADWHPLAVDVYLGLMQSGMAQFYEPSDVAMARVACEALSRNLNQGQRISGQLFASVTSLLTTLGATEGDRRRLRIELDRSEPEQPPSVALMEEYRRAAGTSG